MFAHILAIVPALLIAALIFGLILWAHHADQRRFDRDGLDVCHTSCKYTDLADAVRGAEYRKKNPNLASAVGNFLGELLNAAIAEKKAV